MADAAARRRARRRQRILEGGTSRLDRLSGLSAASSGAGGSAGSAVAATAAEAPAPAVDDADIPEPGAPELAPEASPEASPEAEAPEASPEAAADADRRRRRAEQLADAAMSHARSKGTAIAAEEPKLAAPDRDAQELQAEQEALGSIADLRRAVHRKRAAEDRGGDDDDEDAEDTDDAQAEAVAPAALALPRGVRAWPALPTLLSAGVGALSGLQARAVELAAPDLRFALVQEAAAPAPDADLIDDFAEDAFAEFDLGTLSSSPSAPADAAQLGWGAALAGSLLLRVLLVHAALWLAQGRRGGVFAALGVARTAANDVVLAMVVALTVVIVVGA